MVDWFNLMESVLRRFRMLSVVWHCSELIQVQVLGGCSVVVLCFGLSKVF